MAVVDMVHARLLEIWENEPDTVDGKRVAKDLSLPEEEVYSAFTKLKAQGLIDGRKGWGSDVFVAHRPKWL